MVKISVVQCLRTKCCIKLYDNLTVFFRETPLHQHHLHPECPGSNTSGMVGPHHFTVCVPYSQAVTIYLACDSKQLVSVLYTDTVLEVLDKLSDRLASSESILWVVDNQGRGENICVVTKQYFLFDTLSVLSIYHSCMKGMNSSQITCHR